MIRPVSALVRRYGQHVVPPFAELARDRGGVHTTGVLSISNLDVSGGLVTGEGRGFTGSSPYTLSFTL